MQDRQTSQDIAEKIWHFSVFAQP